MVITKKKTKTQLQQISDVAWLVRQGKNKLGILNKDVQEHYFYITGKEFLGFEDATDVVVHFGNVNLFKEQITDNTTISDSFYIKGHLIDYETPYPLDPTHADYNSDIPLYTKTPDSDVYYAAGWYCINFEKGWKRSHGPKYSTLTNYGYSGPFKTEVDCRQELKRLNKERRLTSNV